MGGTPSVNIGTAGQAHHCTTQSPRKLMVSIHVPEKNAILNLIQLNNFLCKTIVPKKCFFKQKTKQIKSARKCFKTLGYSKRFRPDATIVFGQNALQGPGCPKSTKHGLNQSWTVPSGQNHKGTNTLHQIGIFLLDCFMG